MTERGDNRPYRSRADRFPALPAALFALLALLSCQNESSTIPQNKPALERASVHYMMPPVKAAHEGVIDAEEMLRKDPPHIPAARESLGKARRALANLERFYVPATEARENLYNAYLEDLYGHPKERDTYLDVARRGLLQIAERSGSQLEPYIKDLADRIETVQFHIRDGLPVHEELKSLCEIFQLHLLKAQLVLDENAFDAEGKDSAH